MNWVWLVLLALCLWAPVFSIPTTKLRTAKWAEWSLWSVYLLCAVAGTYAAVAFLTKQ